MQKVLVSYLKVHFWVQITLLLFSEFSDDKYTCACMRACVRACVCVCVCV